MVFGCSVFGTLNDSCAALAKTTVGSIAHLLDRCRGADRRRGQQRHSVPLSTILKFKVASMRPAGLRADRNRRQSPGGDTFATVRAPRDCGDRGRTVQLGAD